MHSNKYPYYNYHTSSYSHMEQKDHAYHKKNIKKLPIIITTHGIGEKRVLLNSQETSTPLTQIAVTLASYHGRILPVSKRRCKYDSWQGTDNM